MHAGVHVRRTDAHEGDPLPCRDLPDPVERRERGVAVEQDDGRAAEQTREQGCSRRPSSSSRRRTADRPGRSSACRVSVFNCSSTTPPWPCTMPLGTPVVPEEKSTQSGWLKSTSSAVHGRWARDDLDPVVRAAPRSCSRAAGSPTQTISRRSRQAVTTSRSTSPRSTDRPLYWYAAVASRTTGLQLLEPRDDRARTELRRDHRPHRTHRGRGQEADDGLAPVGQHGRRPGHPAARRHLAGSRPAPHLCSQLRPAERRAGCRPRRYR